MDDWLEGRITEKRRWTERLYSLRIDAPIDRFTPGQFIRIALDIDGERIARPYSCVNPPDEPGLEIYYNTVEGGPLTTALLDLGEGDTLWVGRNASGFFTLDEVPAAPQLWMLATGTGLGVFLCLLRTAEAWQRFEQLRLVHSVRSVEELTYRERIDEIRDAHPGRFDYIPMVSRESCDFALAGRIPAAIEDGRLEKRAGLRIDPELSQVMLCGNQGMIRDATQALSERGLRRNRRRTPGHITTEKYW
ncbi:ferredoxin--NADP reductase [Acidihalobacter prosperus]